MGFHWFDDLKEICGALHVHTVKSNGAGTLAEVLAAARRAGLSFLIITDHDTRGYADEGAEGWHGEIFVLTGEEISVGAARFIVLGHAGPLDQRQDMRAALAEIRAHGGLSIAVPPEDTTARLPMRMQPEAPAVSDAGAEPPEAEVDFSFPLDLLDGWEFWCGLEDWARGRLDRAPMTDPFTRVEHVGLRGPRRPALRMWDGLAQQSRVLGFAGLNAHGRSWTSTAPSATLPYETLFKSIGCHALTPELPRDDAAAARRLLLESLRAGRFHTSHRGVAPPEGFRFIAELPDQEPLLEGGEGVFHPRAKIRVRLPEHAEIKLIHNGATLFTSEGRELNFPVVAPGVYRGEVWISRRPWIYSNPIWLYPPSSEEREEQRESERRRAAEAARAGFEDLLDIAT